MTWLESIKLSSAARLVSSAAKEIFSEGISEIDGKFKLILFAEIEVS